jgi:hypothetical protein
MKAAALALAVAASLAAAPTDITITATSVNVAEPGTPMRIKLTRWSTDEERTPIVNALKAAPAPVAGRNPSAAEGGARGSRGGARGRGAGRGPAAPLTPIAAFAAALGRAATLGYLWTSDVAGYSIKYAWHTPLPDGSERIVVASDRRLGAYTNAWKTAPQAPETDYPFTLIELRVGSNGSLEGKTSLVGKIAVDNDAKTVALENYNAAPVVMQNVKR